MHMSRIIISLPDELLEDLDVYCEDLRYNRSECIRHAIRLLIQPEDVLKTDGTEGNPDVS